MKKEDLYRAMNTIEDDLLENAEHQPVVHKAGYRGIWPGIAVLAAALVFMVAVPRFRSASSADQAKTEEAVAVVEESADDTGTNTFGINDAEYMAPAEAYDAVEEKERSMIGFYERTLALIDSTTENRVVSPVNIYTAMSLLAEITAGETQKELFTALGVQDAEELRAYNDRIYISNNVDAEELVSMTGNSVWLAEGRDYRKDTLDVLAEQYHADAYQGVMGSGAYNKQLQKWLNDHTGNLLEDSISGVNMSEDTLLALASALYYKAAWTDAFYRGEETAAFHAYSGEEQVTYLKRTDDHGTLYSENLFTAVRLPLYGGEVWLVLPEEGYTVADVLDSRDVFRLLDSCGADARQETGDLHITIPEFDVSCDLSLMDELPALGITKVLTAQADFTNITDDDIALSEIKHAARFMADEDGVSGAAYTIMVFDTAAMIPEENRKDLYFTADRPFLFFVKGSDGSLLFAGTVNHPEKQ